MKIPGLPLGYRFEPSDSDLILNYLYPKATSSNSYQDFIPECDLYDVQESWKRYFHGGETEMYFYTKLKRKKTEKNGHHMERGYGGRVWKSQKEDLVYYTDNEGKKTKMRSRRSFSYKVTDGYGEGTGDNSNDEWVMHEFRLGEVLGGGKSKESDQFAWVFYSMVYIVYDCLHGCSIAT